MGLALQGVGRAKGQTSDSIGSHDPRVGSEVRTEALVAFMWGPQSPFHRTQRVSPVSKGDAKKRASAAAV